MNAIIAPLFGPEMKVGLLLYYIFHAMCHNPDFSSIIAFIFNDRRTMYCRLMNLLKNTFKSAEMFTRLLHFLETRKSYKHGSWIKKQIWKVRRFRF